MALRTSLKKSVVGASIRDVLSGDFPSYGKISANRIRLITWFGSNSNTASLPSGWLPGDLCIVMAYNTASTTTPTLPGTFTNIQNQASNSHAIRCGRRILQAGDTSIGTWTNATQVSAVILRGVNQASPVGGSAVANSTSTTHNLPSVTMTDTDGRSWIVCLGGSAVADANTEDAANSAAISLTPWARTTTAYVVPRVASWAGTTVTLNATTTNKCVSVEVRSA